VFTQGGFEECLPVAPLSLQDLMQQQLSLLLNSVDSVWSCSPFSGKP